mmetsp:Transcript_7840/g.14077  ORF Transcript_7840/g.14077 Transcript_7840/m.14077 type:complete len:183 (-) Transcript_7840:57-605(-)
MGKFMTHCSSNTFIVQESMRAWMSQSQVYIVNVPPARKTGAIVSKNIVGHHLCLAFFQTVDSIATAAHFCNGTNIPTSSIDDDMKFRMNSAKNCSGFFVIGERWDVLDGNFAILAAGSVILTNATVRRVIGDVIQCAKGCAIRALSVIIHVGHGFENRIWQSTVDDQQPRQCASVTTQAIGF